MQIRGIFQTWRRTTLDHSPADDLFLPKAGHWLWNERRKRQEHTRKFNLKALEEVLAWVAGSRDCNAVVQLETLAEGASNKVFMAIVGRWRFIVKIPDPIVPPRMVTASEVATLDFLRSELDLPVPKVFSWSDTSDNLVGCEYIVMEEAYGRPLNVAWSSLEIPAKLAVVDEILSMQKRLIATRNIFGGFGSLYFADEAGKLGISHHLPLLSAGS